MVHDDLEDGARHELETHLEGCATCAFDLSEERRLLGLLASSPGEGPSSGLLQRCRDDLHQALSAQGAEQAVRRSVPWFPPRWRWSPAWALALLLAGFVAGRAFPGSGSRSDRDRAMGLSEEGGMIANVDFHEADPVSDRVSLTYDTLRRTSISGTAGDPDIRRVLLETVRDSRNPGLRLEAIDVLRRHADNRQVRQALLRAVREDENAGARLKALEALKGHAADDPDVRGAIVQALLKDTNPGVRVRAIDALRDARSPETLAVLRRLADADPSEYVRLRSAALVSEMLPEGGAR